MKEYKVLIQEKLLESLKEHLIPHNDEIKDFNRGRPKKEMRYRLKLDVLVLFTSLVNSIPCRYRDDISQNEGIATLNATRMKKAYHDKYDEYIAFLVENGFLINVSRGSAKAHRSSKYRISKSYYKDKLISYEITDKTLLKRLSNNVYLDEIREKMAFCEYKRPHLVKFFDEYLTIDEDLAAKEIEPLNNDDSYSKYLRSEHSINEINEKNYMYSIDPRTDNRLHTTLTRTTKILRKHICYNGENINGLDVKTSQVYFFCAILKAILQKDESLLERIYATKVIDDKLVFKLMNLDLNRKEVIAFVLSILDHERDFYEDFSTKIVIDYNSEGKPIRLESNYKSRDKNKLKKTIKEAYSIVPYENERALAKGAIMEILYSSPGTKISEAAVFRNEYPSISKIMKCIKDYGVELWRLLDYVEAYCLLDYAALKFAQNHPDIFITSIHDCLITVKPNIEMLREEITQYLMEITTLTIPPKFEVETWEQDIV
jgi:hypothetical protein